MRIFAFHRRLSSIILLTLIIPLGSWAIDRTTSGRILDQFKTRQEEILFETIPFTETGANDLLLQEYTMNGLDALKSRLNLIEMGYKMKKTLISEKRFSLEEALRVLNISISQTEDSIKANTDTIEFKSQHLNSLRTSSINTKRKIASYRSTILKYIASIYSE